MDMMEKEKWSGMLVTLGAIDKAGHMWGAYNDQGSADDPTRLAYAAKYADQQLGRMLKRLKDLGQLNDTLIVLTADHGATYARQFYGKDASGAVENNWYYGKAINTENYDKPAPVLKQLVDTGNLQFSYQSTMIEAWLKDNSAEKKLAAAKIMRNLPGVAATYLRDGDHFKLDAGPGQGTAANFGDVELAWWHKHGQALVDTMAADHGPDVVALLADEVGYGAYGDHGGAKAADQRVPMVVWSAKIKAASPDYEFRTVDILPTVLRAMDIKETKPGDGTAFAVEFK
jgi:arylsulfatase A-like enzyme